MCARYTDEASDLEACQLLTTNANNLTSAISEALYRLQCASIRVAKATRVELGLTHNIMGTDPISDKLSPYHKVSVYISQFVMCEDLLSK